MLIVAPIKMKLVLPILAITFVLAPTAEMAQWSTPTLLGEPVYRDPIAVYSSPSVEQQIDSISNKRFVFEEGAIIRGDRTRKQLALVFTGDEFADGANTIIRVLKRHRAQASFFFTCRFYRNPAFKAAIQSLKRDGHYLGAHSNQHLLYCDWDKRDLLLVTKDEFESDLNQNYQAMQSFGISKNNAPFFLPPFEWYNRTISEWTQTMGLTLINFTPGTRSNADYTTPGSDNYVGSDAILKRIAEYEERDPDGLNGFILLMHIGVGPERTDKFYDRLSELLRWLGTKKYQVVRIDRLLCSS